MGFSAASFSAASFSTASFWAASFLRKGTSLAIKVSPYLKSLRAWFCHSSILASNL
jgi:hypothetical protein